MRRERVRRESEEGRVRRKRVREGESEEGE